MKPKTSSNDQKQKTKTQKQEIRPSTINTLAYQGLFQNGLMQVSPSYFSQTYLLGDVNYQTVGLDDKGAIVEKYSDLINSLDDKTNFQLTIFNQKLIWKNSVRVFSIPYRKMGLMLIVMN